MGDWHGPEEIRTPDPYNANVMRSQLRYGPVYLGIIPRPGAIVKENLRQKGNGFFPFLFGEAVVKYCIRLRQRSNPYAFNP